MKSSLNRVTFAVASMALAIGCQSSLPTIRGAQIVHLTEANGDGPRVLCVVAHPDDEVAFAGTIYKISTHLRGACDIVVITNGEGGYKYSTLGERVYRKRLTEPRVGRAQLPSIRQREHAECGRILGVRDVYYLNQTDHRFTLDPMEVLGDDAEVWRLGSVRSTLRAIVARGRYDFVFTHLPVPNTHGHHKAATVLALEAVAAMRPADRPVALGAYATGRATETPTPPIMLAGFPATRVRTEAGPFWFDRAQSFGFKRRLSYQIVVNWAIAAHKSQGTFQLMMNRWNRETYRVYALHAPGAVARAAELFGRLREPQFAAVDYDANGDRR